MYGTVANVFLGPEEEYYDDYDYEESGRYEEEDRSNVANLYPPAQQFKIATMKPTEYNDAAKIANELMNLSLVVLNTSEVQKRNPDDVRRIWTFCPALPMLKAVP